MRLRFYAKILLGFTAATSNALSAPPHPTPPAKRQQQPFSLPPQPTRVVSGNQDGTPITAELVTTTVEQYKDIRASMVLPDSDPPAVLYPRNLAVVGAAAVAVVGIIFGGIQDSIDAERMRLQPVTLESLQGSRPAIAIDDDPGCPKPAPKCNTCGGNSLALCGNGGLKGCPCQPDSKCPTDRPKCRDQTCKGDEINRCTAGNLAGCSCKGPAGGIPIRDLYDGAWLDTQQQILAMFDQGSQTCSKNNVQNLPAGLLMGVGAESPNQLLFRMREVLCNNKCEQPANLPSNGQQLTQIYPSVGSDKECEISIAIQNNIEAWIYRTTPAKDSEQQQCWDATEQIINNCIQNQGNTGWSNGPDDYQFYQVGFRPLNGPGSKHTTKFTGNDYLKDSFTALCRSDSKSLGDVSKNVKDNANKVCQALKDRKVVMDTNNVQLPSDFYKVSQISKGTSNGDTLVFSLVWSKQACKDPNNPTSIDFSSYSMDTCVQNFVDNNAAKCPNGGTFSADCGLWGINAS
ncbi:MAG: hypothetical protein M1839_009526 [Geoglossum umbratile]|nr:MAG: hypothetical protein M1839_009526 [Geoglossum umbratile]